MKSSVTSCSFHRVIPSAARDLLLLLAVPAALGAQTDTATTLKASITTAERASTSLASSVAAVTRLSADQLARIPRATLADVLRFAPGIGVVNFDGLGFDPVVMPRGFYGGGEAEYVLVMVNGRPVSRMETGTVAWDFLPAATRIDAVEVVRGSSSSLYGDAAVGGVINVITRPPASVHGTGFGAEGSLAGGSFGTWRSDFAVLFPELKRLGVSIANDRTEGFRDHAARKAARLGASVGLVATDHSSLGIAVNGHRREYDEPGALIGSRMDADRTSSDPLFKFDHTDDDDGLLSLSGARKIGDRGWFTASLSGESRTIDAVRTLALAPGFGDTKARHTEAKRGTASVQLELAKVGATTDRLVAGLELTGGSLDSRYEKMLTGPTPAYAAATNPARTPDAEGDAGRATAALFADYMVVTSSALKLSLGGRLDKIEDRFGNTTSGAARVTKSHAVVNPRAGVNWGYSSNGNLYASFARTFKAPTLDQRFDQRSFPVPFPPFSVTTSNANLEPQSGMSLESGIYHTSRQGASRRAEINLDVYQIDMKDELDFDVASLRYVNIGESRHRGVEAAATLFGPKGSLMLSYAFQSATSRTGASSGNQLKAIPKNLFDAMATFHPLPKRPGFEASLLANYVGGAFIDDANTIEMPNRTRFDARFSFKYRNHTLFADVRNLFDKTYASTAFMDPSGSGQIYYYPAAGRVFEIGLRAGGR